MDSSLLKKWVEKGVITPDQARIMRLDIDATKKKVSTNKIVSSISTIGAVLLGLGFITLVASNWQAFSSMLKILIFSAGTAVSYYTGYVLKYKKRKLVKVGAAMLLLSALMYGATIFLVAQIYNVNADNHILLLLWLVGVLPMAYVLKNKAFAMLSMVLFYTWLGFFSFRSFGLGHLGITSWLSIPVLITITSVFVFLAGGFHFLKKELRTIGRIFRIFSIKVGMLMLFLFTFRGITGKINSDYLIESRLIELGSTNSILSQFPTILFLAVATIALAFAYLLKNPTKTKNYLIEGGVSLATVLLMVVFMFSSRTTNLFTYIFNLIFIGVSFELLIEGYKRHDMKLIDMGGFYISLFIATKYIDLFWDLLPTSIFFLIGGVILVGGGAFIEGRRKDLVKEFGQTPK